MAKHKRTSTATRIAEKFTKTLKRRVAEKQETIPTKKVKVGFWRGLGRAMKKFPKSVKETFTNPGKLTKTLVTAAVSVGLGVAVSIVTANPFIGATAALASELFIEPFVDTTVEGGIKGRKQYDEIPLENAQDMTKEKNLEFGKKEVKAKTIEAPEGKQVANLRKRQALEAQEVEIN